MMTQVGADSQRYLYFTACVAAVGGLFFGFDAGVISSAILFIQKDFHLTQVTNGLVISAVMLGGLLGSLVVGRVADFYGRKKMIVISAAIFAFGALVSSCAMTLMWLMIGRVVTGFAIGMVSVLEPLYISEISPANRRGTLVFFNQLFMSLGIVFAYIVTYIYAFSANWRVMLEFGVFPAILLFLGSLFIPESPRWLLICNREDEAVSVLEKLGSSADELVQVKNNLVNARGDWRMLFKPWILPAALITFGLAFFQQFMGASTIIYYAPTIFAIAGFKYATSAILATLGMSIVGVLFTLLAMVLVDRWGRRPLLLLGLGGMALGLMFLHWTFIAIGHDDIIVRWSALLGILLYLFCFCLSIGPILWLMVSEVFPQRIRGMAASLTISVHWGLNMIVAATFLSLITWFKPEGVFLLYSIVAMCACLFVYFLVPETKGVSLECIEANLRAGKSSRDLGNLEQNINGDNQ